ncbi:MAG: preprotein translocase subunit SecY [Clostridia bacterium]
MLQTLKDIFSVKDIKKKILYVFFIIVLYRIGSFITVPGINKIAFMEDFNNASNGILGTINIISGGAFSRLSIFAMTIGPYITASIILNLLQIVIPSLEKLAREGETGKKKLAKYTKYLTVAFALVEGVGLYLQYRKFLVGPLLSGAGMIVGLLLFVSSLMAGTALLMWLSDKITETGLGNGVSMIIFVSIVSRAPAAVSALVNYATSLTHVLVLVAFVAAMIALVAGVIFVQQAERRIPVNYAKRVVGRRMMGGQNTHIPLKVAMAGVIPVIFAMSFMMFPATIIQIVSKGAPTGFWKGVYDMFSMNTGNVWGLIAYALIYMILILVFTFFYTTIIVNPIEMANGLKKNGGFIPGIRAGKPTSDYISNVLNNITWAGGFFLALVAVLPILVQGLMPALKVSFGGTSILIVVGVALEILKQLESQMVSRHYKGFID